MLGPHEQDLVNRDPAIPGLATVLDPRRLLEDEPGRKALYERFKYSQRFAQIDPWKARAEGAEGHEFTPLKIA